MNVAARWAALVAVVLAAPASAASASTVSAELTNVWSGGYTLRYVAAAGERNDVTMQFLAGAGRYHDAVRISDAGAVIEAREGCRSIDPHAVECRIADRAPGGSESIFDFHEVDLGDLDDTVRFRFPARIELSMDPAVSGGPGADTIHAAHSARADGGPGPDHLIAPAAGFAQLDGGSGADLLTGSEHYDKLVGGPGPDRLLGRGGDDRLFGDDPFARIFPVDAQDSLDGGEGNDWLDGGPAVNAIACGPGADTSTVALPRDIVPFDCERVAFMVDYEWDIAFALPPRPVGWRGSTAVFSVPCGELEEPWGYEFAVPCRGSIVLREATGRRRLLGRAAVPGRAASVRLNALGMRLAGQPSGALVTVTVRGHDIGRPNGWTFRLRRPRQPAG